MAMPTKYEHVVTTERSAELLSRIYGFSQIAELIASIPKNASILDIGAGASPLGSEVASRRPDVTWTNLDYSYYDTTILNDIRSTAPKNLKYVAGDATKLREAVGTQKFGMVFSYWMLPHLSLYEAGPAMLAAKALFAATESGGSLFIGPILRHYRLPRIKPIPGKEFKKGDFKTAAEFAETVVALTTARGIPRFIPIIANEVETPYFGTSRYFKRQGHKNYVLDPKSGKFINPFSGRGVVIAVQLVARTARFFSQRRKT
jgi:hypothetical protein